MLVPRCTTSVPDISKFVPRAKWADDLNPAFCDPPLTGVKRDKAYRACSVPTLGRPSSLPVPYGATRIGQTLFLLLHIPGHAGDVQRDAPGVHAACSRLLRTSSASVPWRVTFFDFSIDDCVPTDVYRRVTLPLLFCRADGPGLIQHSSFDDFRASHSLSKEE
jgi:hypothetical protein